MSAAPVLRLEELGAADVPRLGGKNASLGKMIGALSGAGVRVPPGFATTAEAFRDFVAANGIGPAMAARLEALKRGGEQPSGLRRLPGGARHRFHLAQPGWRRGGGAQHRHGGGAAVLRQRVTGPPSRFAAGPGRGRRRQRPDGTGRRYRP